MSKCQTKQCNNETNPLKSNLCPYCLSRSPVERDTLTAKAELFDEFTSFVDKQARTEMNSLEFEFRVITELASVMAKAKELLK